MNFKNEARSGFEFLDLRGGFNDYADCLVDAAYDLLNSITNYEVPNHIIYDSLQELDYGFTTINIEHLLYELEGCEDFEDDEDLEYVISSIEECDLMIEDFNNAVESAVDLMDDLQDVLNIDIENDKDKLECTYNDGCDFVIDLADGLQSYLDCLNGNIASLAKDVADNISGVEYYQDILEDCDYGLFKISESLSISDEVLSSEVDIKNSEIDSVVTYLNKLKSDLKSYK